MLEKDKLKEKIKSLPIIGFMSRWLYNILRINNLKYFVIENKNNIEKQNIIINEQKEQLLSQKELILQQQDEIKNLKQELEDLSDELEKSVKLVVREQVINQYKLLNSKVEDLCQKTKAKS